jgi:hypothetical protein
MKTYGLRMKKMPRRSIHLAVEPLSQIRIGKYNRKLFPLWIDAFRQGLAKCNGITKADTIEKAEECDIVWDLIALFGKTYLPFAI